MSFRSRSSFVQGTKTTKLRKASTTASLQNEKFRSAPNLLDVADANIGDIFQSYVNSHNGEPNIRVIFKNNIFSTSVRKFKDEADDQEEIILANYVTEEYNKPSVYFYGRYEYEGPLRVTFRNKVNEHIVSVLNLVKQHFKNLLILQLAFCDLKDSHIPLLKTVLVENINIKSLSLEGNPLLLQSYNDILQTQLTHLSLRSCQVTLVGVKHIAEQLQDCYLISLNLSSNYLDNDCLQLLSNSLRLNRKLSTLNLADNWFTDIGLVNFIKVFKRFPLVHSEIILRRRANFEYLREQQDMVKDLMSSGFEPTAVPVKSLRYPIKKNAFRPSSASSSSQKTISPKARATMITKDKISAKMTKDGNPVIVECFPEDKAIYCYGNFTLSTINLSCNNITSLSLKEIIDVLKYQNEFCNANKCLQKLVFDDGLNRKYTLELLHISELLKTNNKTSRFKTDKPRMSSASILTRSSQQL